MHTCALVSRSGSIDWCCLPSFDSPAAFSRILDWSRGGYYQVTVQDIESVSRRYLPRTNVLETTFTTTGGVATLTDFMPVHPSSRSRAMASQGGGTEGRPSSGTLRVKHPRAAGMAHARASGELLEPIEISFEEKLVRLLECTEGVVEFLMVCQPRFDYGLIMPRAVLDATRMQYGLAHGGASALLVYCSEPMQLANHGFRSTGRLQAGRQLTTAVTSMSHYSTDFSANDAWLGDAQIHEMRERTVRFWEGWSEGCHYDGEMHEEVLRSALALKALTYEPSGAICAAATTSLPEMLGGERNWDYRFTWIRDATFSLKALFDIGLSAEAAGFKDWLEWTAAYPEDLQLMYGLRGERWLPEQELPLEGYRWSSPVRTGNGAATQFQLDIYGELMDSAYLYEQLTSEPIEPDYWGFLCDVVDFTCAAWRRPDAGIWETRGGDRHFVYSKVMCWVALDRGIKLAEKLGDASVDLDRWKATRDEIKADVLAAGYDPITGTFVQSYGSRALDASALMMPLVGFVEATDPRMRSTIEAIERELTSPAGLVYRYRDFNDGLSGTEGTFSICSFWLVQNLIALGELDKAGALLDKLRSYANDLGLFSEEVDTETGEMLGNYPQAFSHLAFIQSAVQLDRARRAAPNR
jgi:GH15 family glucan-1,4-alpha-glucosidase